MKDVQLLPKGDHSETFRLQAANAAWAPPSCSQMHYITGTCSTDNTFLWNKAILFQPGLAFGWLVAEGPWCPQSRITHSAPGQPSPSSLLELQLETWLASQSLHKVLRHLFAKRGHGWTYTTNGSSTWSIALLIHLLQPFLPRRGSLLNQGSSGALSPEATEDTHHQLQTQRSALGGLPFTWTNRRSLLQRKGKFKWDKKKKLGRRRAEWQSYGQTADVYHSRKSHDFSQKSKYLLVAVLVGQKNQDRRTAGC